MRGLNPLVVFGLGAFAAGSAGRQLVLATRRQGWRGLVGRANGGMIVHIGVVVIAVAFAASHSFAHRTQVSLQPGQSQTLAGHTITYLGVDQVNHPNRRAVEARLRVDGGKIYRPAISQYHGGSTPVGTPSVRSTHRDDLYLTLVDAPQKPGDPAIIGIIVQPLIMWLWIGGGIMAIGTALAAWPGRRRNPIEPVSAPVGGRKRTTARSTGNGVASGDSGQAVGAGTGGGSR